MFSPLDVINNKNKNNYKDHYIRIKDADLYYPIIIDSKMNIIDGMNRLAKAYLNKLEFINVYIFNDDLMEKFVVSYKKGNELDNSDWDYYDSLSKGDIEKLYRERFNIKNNNIEAS